MYENFIKNGYSSGDDLLGFAIDVECYLNSSNLLANVEVKSSSNKECLISATCNYTNDISETRIIEELCTIWKSSLRYQEFEKHDYEYSDGKVVFYFCTTSGPLGVTGKIIAQQDP